MSEATPRQLDVLRAIDDLTLALGWPPSRKELADRLGLSVSRVQQRVEELVELGLVRMEPRCSRAIQLTERGRAQLVALATIAGAP